MAMATNKDNNYMKQSFDVLLAEFICAIYINTAKC